MSYLLYVLMQLMVIKACTITGRKHLTHECVHFLLIFLLPNVTPVLAKTPIPSLASASGSDIKTKEAFITFDPIHTQDINVQRNVERFSVIGTYISKSVSNEATGTIYQMPSGRDGCSGNDDLVFSKHPKEWVALYHFPQIIEQTIRGSSTNESVCPGVTDRVKNAMMFGASAILILVLNPKIVQELDMGQLLTRPVILIQTATNVSAIMEALLRHLSWKVKVSAKKLDSLQTVTVWSMCWRSRPGSGVICRSDSHLSKEDPGHFWNYFFTLLATLILLMILKTNRGQDEDMDNLDQGQAFRQIAVQALAMMTIKRFKPVTNQSRPPSHVANTNPEICAICLDNFYPRQRLRVLPCSHEFHTKCVDPWLLKHPTCPLCKLNIVDLQLKKAAQT